MPDTRPFLLPVTVLVGAVEHAGSYFVEGGQLTVRYAGDEMTVELGEAVARTRAEVVLGALVKRRERR